VLQIGADIYCDSDLILRVIDRLFPDPPLYADGASALAFALRRMDERAGEIHVHFPRNGFQVE
jgi:hypothetical protein